MAIGGEGVAGRGGLCLPWDEERRSTSLHRHSSPLWRLLATQHACCRLDIRASTGLPYIPLPQVVCTKVRDGDARMVQLKEGSPQGRHVVIVDDLVQSGEE